MKSDSNTSRQEDQSTPTEECYVLGGGELGKRVSDHLRASGHDVEFVDDGDSATGVTHEGDPTDARVLDELGGSSGVTVVVATREDGANLLAAQLSRIRLEPDRVVVLANSPEAMELLADAGHDPVCATTVLSNALVEKL
jgi:trk system potassium uptake protein TrkA